MKRISYDDYLRLCGLLALAADHRRMLEALEASACALTGDAEGGHTSDAIWGGEHRSAAKLLALLDIKVAPAPKEE